MRKLTKSVSALLVVVMLMSVVLCAPFTASAAVNESENVGATSGGFVYILFVDGTAKITGYNGTKRVLTIPSGINGYTVTSIGDSAFKNCTRLQSVIIPDSVTSIGDFAFSDCTSLASVTIPDSVTRIDYYAFWGCTNLVSVTIPDSVTLIDVGVFDGCTNLESVTIPNSVTSIGDDAFSSCTSLTNVIIPNSVTSIGNYAFFRCTSIASITIPDSVKSIGVQTFQDCTSLTSVTIPNSVISIGLEAFAGCTSLASVTIPNSVTSIDDYAFAGCTNLVSVTISDSVTLIDGGVFSGCTNLESVTIPNSVTYIGGYAFSDCTSLASVTIPNSVTYIGDYAFSKCTSLKDVYYSGSKEEWKEIYIQFYISSNSSLKNATIHFNSEGPFHSFTSSNGLEELKVGETARFAVSVSKNNLNGDVFPDKKVEWKSSNNSVMSIERTGGECTYVYVKGCNLGTSVLSLYIDGEKVFSKEITVAIPDEDMISNYSSYINDNASMTTLKNAQKVTKDIIKQYSAWDRFKISFFTILDEGLGVETVAKQTAADMGFADDMYDEALKGVTQDILSDYFEVDDYALKSDLDAFKKEWSVYKSGEKIISNLTSDKSKKSKLKQTVSSATDLTESQVGDIFDKFEKAASGVDNAVSIYQIAGTAMMIAQYDKDTVKSLIDIVPKSSMAYEGLSKVYKDMNKNFATYCIEKYASKKVVEKVAKLIAQGIFTQEYIYIYNIAKSFGKIIAYVYKQNGGVTMDGYLKAVDSNIIAKDFLTLIPKQKNMDSLRLVFEFCVSATRVALKNGKNISDTGDAYLANLNLQAEDYLKKIQKLNFNTYIKQCRNELKLSSKYTSNVYIDENNNIVCEVYYVLPKSKSLLKSSADDTSGEQEENICVIPTKVEDNIVQKIADNGFSDITDINGFFLPDSIKEIGNYSFANCANAESVMLGNNISSIGEGAFSGCTLLNDIILPDSLESINSSAFEECSSLKSANIGGKVIEIGENAFKNCTSLETVYFNGCNTTISDNAFDGCQSTLIIYGYAGSTAEEFANSKGFEFVDIGNAVKSLEILTPANNTDYKCGDDVSAEGLTLKAEYYNGESEVVESGFSVAYDTSKAGKGTVNISYGNALVSYEINIEETEGKEILLNRESVNLIPGEESVLNVVITPIETSSQEYTIESDNESVAKVKNNTIIAIAPGQATITVKTKDESAEKKCNVTVESNISVNITEDNPEKYIYFTAQDTDRYVFSLLNKIDCYFSLYDGNGNILGEFSSQDENRSLSCNASLEKDNLYVMKIGLVNQDEGEVNITFEKSSAVIGDVNGDGSVTVLDATVLQKYLAGLDSLSDEQLAVADTNGDGQITVLDATAIQKYLANLVTSLG
ncbi:leucine-rich repeat protein [uncultured Ruminococcus sp.]|uniref:leucine-rich repeat protein n=1 Tax=uncultured Ruminococcus sp. TaxID=165186 RepID=UPI0025EB9E8E|nr:leucine-rich repeat protein [uncultured Ruminococcus sp.]